MTEQATFTAAEIARALGRKRQAIARLLESVPPSGQRIVSGNVANAWAFSALPARLQLELNQQAARGGYRHAEAMLTEPPKIWAAPLPISQVRAEFIERAIKLREALAAPLARQHELNSAELLALGLAEYGRAFGYTVGPKQWNRLFDRAVLRDGGCENWQRLEIYLDDAAFTRPLIVLAQKAERFDHSALDEVIAQVIDKQRPTADDRAWLLDAAFRHFEAACAERPRAAEQAAFKASLVAHLFSALPGLAKRVSALRRTFDRKLAQWRGGGRTTASLRDSRSLASGNFRAVLCESCRKTLRALTIAHDENESIANRLMHQRDLWCEPCRAYRSRFNARRNKSAVLESDRKAIAPEVETVGPLHRGSHEARMRGPYKVRNWSDVLPGDWFNADDVTWNHYFRDVDAAGNLVITRGECLLMIDLRTGYPLAFSVIAGPYNGEHIRGLILRTHDTVGLPNNGFYFESGVWKSRLIVGANSRDSLPWRETELGLREHGLDLDVRTATTPRAKIVEGLLRIIQERMRSIPGFVGFNERTDKRERVQEMLTRARAGHERAIAQLPTHEEWVATVGAVLDEFAQDPQNGRMLKGVAPLGMSPAEMWNEARSRQPLRRLPDEARYTLATHRKPVRVRQEGIVLQVRGQRMLFANEHTGRLIGRDVLAHYNIEEPELLTVCDRNRQNFFTVKRIELPAMDATPEQFAEANAQIRGHRAAAKVLYGEIRHALVSTVTRDNAHDEGTKQLGRLHNEAQAAHRAEKSERTRKLRRIQTAAAVAGAAVPPHVRNPDRVLQGIELERAIRERLATKEQEPAHE